jgi:hypothetical protein
MKDPETDRLVAEMATLPEYRGWRFSYEYPGYFCYSHPDNAFSVFFTPDWEGAESLPIEVQVDDGRHCAEHSSLLPLPREDRTGQQIFGLVRPTLDKLATLRPQPPVPTFTVTVELTADEIAALDKAHEHVRATMAHQHSWEIRDAALSGIGKLLTAARSVQS